MHLGFFRVICSCLIWLLLKENKQTNSYAEIEDASLMNYCFWNRRASSFWAAQEEIHLDSQIEGEAPLDVAHTKTLFSVNMEFRLGRPLNVVIWLVPSTSVVSSQSLVPLHGHLVTWPAAWGQPAPTLALGRVAVVMSEGKPPPRGER